MFCQRNETVASANLQNAQNKFHRIVFENAANIPTNNSVLAQKWMFPRGFPVVDFNCSDSVSAKYKKLKIL
jgi:hypothetical protein